MVVGMLQKGAGVAMAPEWEWEASEAQVLLSEVDWHPAPCHPPTHKNCKSQLRMYQARASITGPALSAAGDVTSSGQQALAIKPGLSLTTSGRLHRGTATASSCYH